MNQKKPEQFMVWIQWLVIVIFIVASISLCFNNNIWTDEAFTMQLLQQDFIGIIKGTAADVHPPLYYLIAKIFWLIFGPSLQVQKVLSVIPAALTLLFGATKIKKMFGNKTATVFVLLLAVLPCTLVHAIQPRMYTWGLLFVTVCGVFAYDVYLHSKWQKWGIMILAGTAAAYTHYFALIAVAYIYLFLLIALLIQKKKRWKAWLAASAITVILYIPWLLVWIEQFLIVAQDYHIADITLETIWSYLEFVFKTSTPYSTLLFLILFFLAGITMIMTRKKVKAEEKCFAFLCILIPIGTTLMGIILSFLIRPIYNDRYVYPAMGLLVLFLAIAVKEWKKPLQITICLFFTAIGIVGYQDTYREEYLSTKAPETEQFFEENLGENDIILYNFKGFGFIYEHYWPKDKLIYIENMNFTQDYNTVWFLDSYNFPEIKGELLNTNHLQKEFMGLYGIEHNEFELYKITRLESAKR